MPKREEYGLHVWTNGKRDNPQSWLTFVNQVTRAAVKTKTRQKTGKPVNPPDNLSGMWARGIPDDRRCDFYHSRGPKAGARCASWAMKGATRCRAHGGYRQNPKHPATISKLDTILDRNERIKAERQVRWRMDPKTVETIKQALENMGAAQDFTLIRDGVIAVEQDDNGKSFRRWQAQVKRHTPKTELRARKKRLNSRG